MANVQLNRNADLLNLQKRLHQSVSLESIPRKKNDIALLAVSPYVLPIDGSTLLLNPTTFALSLT